MARRIHKTLEGLDVQALLRDLLRRVYRHQLVHLHVGATITEASGYVGNFVTRVEEKGRVTAIHHGVTILATGADEYRPSEYLYGKDERVVTQLELEERLATDGKAGLGDTRSVVMIQCVGCRQEDRNYCARICCSHAIKNALALTEMASNIQVYVLFRDMRTYGFREDYYREAADRGVSFVRWEPEAKPRVAPAKEEGRPVLRVSVPDPILGQELELDADLVVLSAAAVPAAGSQEIARLFKVSTNPDGFFQEAHVKLRPVDFAADGVFLCGTNHYPKHISEALSQAHGAAGRAVTLLSHDTVTASGSVCEVKEESCVSCGACITACAYDAIAWRETPRGKKASVNPVLCKGDGLCCSKCPTHAIYLKHFTDEEVFHQIDAALSCDSWSSASEPGTTPNQE